MVVWYGCVGRMVSGMENKQFRSFFFRDPIILFFSFLFFKDGNIYLFGGTCAGHGTGGWSRWIRRAATRPAVRGSVFVAPVFSSVGFSRSAPTPAWRGIPPELSFWPLLDFGSVLVWRLHAKIQHILQKHEKARLFGKDKY